ncbi:MAG: hypothetical protein JXR56_05565 [Candidatus Cloacimonetes bacterium]|nr:hypothetical protein [Candidatus Cloacimonadota bacterium]
MHLKSLFIIILLTLTAYLSAEKLSLFTAQDYYTTELTTSLMILSDTGEYPSIDSLSINGERYKSEKLRRMRKGIITCEFPITYTSSDSLDIIIYQAKETISRRCSLTILPDKLNAVKIDRLRGCVIADDLPFFPAGFYTYSPVQPTLMEEEVVRGFNLISPYQKIESETRAERIYYLDRAYELGLKVNYNLLSVAGGGGVDLKEHDFTDMGKVLSLLREEVTAIKDHPALLSWYISDEPYANGVKPEYLEMIYDLIKGIDPYHPITIVFMKATMAKNYENALDIAMADPYPLPVRDIYEIEKVTHRLTNEFFPERLVWNVPQAFGGSEWWRREPTPLEMRSMLYLALLNGSSGYQFFIRKGLNGFPKSTQVWNTSSEVMLEMQQIVPWLFSGEANPEVDDGTLAITSKGYKLRESAIYISVNGENFPRELVLKTPDNFTGKAEVLFENRSVDVKDGIVRDYLDNFGIRVYRIYYSNKPNIPRETDETMINPGFERNYTAGVPAGCYANVAEGRGITYFIDPRVAANGLNSLRMNNYPGHSSFNLSFYPVKVRQNTDYTLSIRAKKARQAEFYLPPQKVKRTFWEKLLGKEEQTVTPKISTSFFYLKFGNYTSPKYNINENWDKYSFNFKFNQGSKQIERFSPRIVYEGPGTAWFDDFELLPLLNLSSVNKDGTCVVTAVNGLPGAVFRYTLNGDRPTVESPVMPDSLKLCESGVIKVCAFKDKQEIAFVEREFVLHKAIFSEISFIEPISVNYPANGAVTLCDAMLATDTHFDGNWLGFDNGKLDFVVKLESTQQVNSTTLRFLQSPENSIVLPESVDVSYSLDGSLYSEVHRIKILTDDTKQSRILKITFDEEAVPAKFIRIKAFVEDADKIMMMDEVIIN